MAQLTTTQFQALVRGALARFSRDWSEHQESDPAIFPDSLPDLQWWEAFAEFAQEEIVNPRITAGATDGRPDAD